MVEIQIEFILWEGLDKVGNWIGGKEYFFALKNKAKPPDSSPIRQNYIIAQSLGVPELDYWTICRNHNDHEGIYIPKGKEHFESREDIMSCMFELVDFCKDYYKSANIRKNIEVDDDKIIIADN